jgi:hypothetical protein
MQLFKATAFISYQNHADGNVGDGQSEGQPSQEDVYLVLYRCPYVWLVETETPKLARPSIRD